MHIFDPMAHITEYAVLVGKTLSVEEITSPYLTVDPRGVTVGAIPKLGRRELARFSTS